MKKNSITGFQKLLLTLKIVTLILICSNLNLYAATTHLLITDDLQQQYITGKVTDSQNGQAMPGVNILIKGTTTGVMTDVEGKYSIAVPDRNAVLVFSFIGYRSEEIPFAGRSVIDASLVPEVKGLDEVVVVGYGTQKKTSLTAAVSSIKAEKLTSIPASNMSTGLGGRVPGLIVRQSTGEPGKDANSIYIRGISSTGSTQALYVVDGIPRDFLNLDPNTIESFTVLKDAAAVAPYGVAGANGVILITTRRGKTGAPTLTYNGFMGFQNMAVMPGRLSAFEFASLKNAASVNVGGNPVYRATDLQKFKDGSDPDGHPNWDVYDAMFDKNTPLTNHSIVLSGGTDRVKYYASVGYQHQAGIWSVNSNNRYNYSMNIDADITRTTKLSFSIKGREQQNKASAESTDKLFEYVHYAFPTEPLFLADGKPGTFFSATLLGAGSSKNNVSQIYTQVSVEQELSFIRGLKAKGTVAFDPTTIRNKVFRLPSYLWSVDTTQIPYKYSSSIYGQLKPSLNQSMEYSKQLTSQVSLVYDKSFGRNAIGGLVLFEAKANDITNFGAERRNYEVTIDELSMGSTNVNDISNSGTSSSGRQMGLVYRITYNYDQKYLFEASGRNDGSYYFAKGKRWGFFPAFSLGWRISEENFMGNLTWLDNLKLRGSYGESGALAGSPFQFLSMYNVSGPVAVLNGAAVQAATEGAEPNLNITWEKAKKNKHRFGCDSLERFIAN